MTNALRMADRTLTIEELDCDDQIYGVPVAFIGEERTEVVAVTSDWRRGAAAIHALTRIDNTLPAYATSVELVWVRFSSPVERYQDCEEWVISPCQAGDAGAMRVVWAKNLTPYVPGLRQVVADGRIWSEFRSYQRTPGHAWSTVR